MQFVPAASDIDCQIIKKMRSWSGDVVDRQCYVRLTGNIQVRYDGDRVQATFTNRVAEQFRMQLNKQLSIPIELIHIGHSFSNEFLVEIDDKEYFTLFKLAYAGKVAQNYES